MAERLVVAGTSVVTRTSFQYGAERIEIQLKPVGNLPGLISPRRWLLDPMLLQSAVDAGAELRLSTAFEAPRGPQLPRGLRRVFSASSSGLSRRQEGDKVTLDVDIVATTVGAVATLEGGATWL